MATHAQLSGVIKAALVIAIMPPARRRSRSQHANAYVPWRDIERLRAALEDAGVDWNAIQRKMQQEVRDDAAARRAEQPD
jgi:hypothetical protein